MMCKPKDGRKRYSDVVKGKKYQAIEQPVRVALQRMRDIEIKGPGCAARLPGL